MNEEPAESTKGMLQIECGCLAKLVIGDRPEDIHWEVFIPCPAHHPRYQHLYEEAK
jgi:hypothetical protein